MDYVSKSHASWKEIRVTRVCSSSWAREFFVRAMQVNKRELDQTGNRCSGIPVRENVSRETRPNDENGQASWDAKFLNY